MSAASSREERYLEIEKRVLNTLESPTLEQALTALNKCPRRSGFPALGSYYCECPACDPEVWGIEPLD